MARCNVLAKHRLSPIRLVLAGRARRRHHVGRHRDSRRAQGRRDESAELHALRLSAERREGTYFQLRRDLSARRTHARHSGHSIAIDPDELRPFRPTYRLLSYVLSKQGYAIDSELAGEDRPDSVGALMRGIFAWAGIGQGLGGDEVRLSCERGRYGARALSVKPRGCFGVRVIADYWL